MRQCGEIETVKHYLIECEMYENGREQLQRKMFEICGIANLDMNLFLYAKHDDIYNNWRNVILSKLETFVVGTKRFPTLNLN